MPTTSRLYMSTNAPMRDLNDVRKHCDNNSIGYSTSASCLEKILPSNEYKLKGDFYKNYNLASLPPTSLKEYGTSSILVLEPKVKSDRNPTIFSNHGEASAAISKVVGNSLEQGIDSLYIHAPLDPHQRKIEAPQHLESVRKLVEDQGLPVIQTSIGWEDNSLDFDEAGSKKANHLWRVTGFLVDSAGNDGRLGYQKSAPPPVQKHNSLSHLAPLVVHVGAAAMDDNGVWKIEGYSSANSPTLLAPVAKHTNIHWRDDNDTEGVLGSSAAAPYISGVLAALNKRYGAYLTREQILYAVLATCTTINTVSAFPPQTEEKHTIFYETNKAGLLYNPEYAGFGLIDPHKADQILLQMVAIAQENPESITEPTSENVTLKNCDKYNNPDAKGLYHYMVKMPSGIALKTTVETEFVGERGSVSITSPSGTKLPMSLSNSHIFGDLNQKNFGMSTCHGWAGENLAGEWIITSTSPINRLRLDQYHFLEKDLVKNLNVQELLNQPAPDLSTAIPLRVLKSELVHRVSHHILIPKHSAPHGLMIGDKIFEMGDAGYVIQQLKNLPSGFETRNRKPFLQPPYIDKASEAAILETEANKLIASLANSDEKTNTEKDKIHHQIAETQIAAAEKHEEAGKTLEQIIPLCSAGYNYLACNYVYNENLGLNAEKAIPIYQKALKISEKAELYDKCYEISWNLYTAMCRCCENGKAGEYASQLPELRSKAIHFSNIMNGGVDNTVHSIGEGEFGFSYNEKIGTDNTSQCITLAVQDPITLKTGVVHLSHHNDIESLDKFFEQFDNVRLNIRLIGARFDADTRSEKNLLSVMRYLSKKDVDIISADIYGGNDGASAVVVDPQTFTLEEKAPYLYSENTAISNVKMLYAKQGIALAQQFDFTKNKNRNPIYMPPNMLEHFRKNYLGKSEWQIESYLDSQEIYDRPLVVEHIMGMTKSYNEQWQSLSATLDNTLNAQDAGAQTRNRAKSELKKLGFFVGENTNKANEPIHDWIRNKLLQNGEVQYSATVQLPLLGEIGKKIQL